MPKLVLGNINGSQVANGLKCLDCRTVTMKSSVLDLISFEHSGWLGSTVQVTASIQALARAVTSFRPIVVERKLLIIALENDYGETQLSLKGDTLYVKRFDTKELIEIQVKKERSYYDD